MRATAVAILVIVAVLILAQPDGQHRQALAALDAAIYEERIKPAD